MEIKLLDKNTVFIKGKKESLLIDPSESILKKDKNSRVVIFTDDSLNNGGFLGEKILIDGAGEYEVGGVEINGWDVEGDRAIYKMKVDGVSVMFLGELRNVLSDKKIEKIEGIDVLIAPVTIGGKVSYKLIKDWAKTWGANYLLPIGESEDLKIFLDDADEEGLEAVDSLKVTEDDLPDGLELKLLKIIS